MREMEDGNRAEGVWGGRVVCCHFSLRFDTDTNPQLSYSPTKVILPVRSRYFSQLTVDLYTVHGIKAM